MIKFYLPRKQLSLIDAINRRAAATGSSRYAMLTANADYNGHALVLCWNDYRGYYVGEYYWGERVVLVRSTDFVVALNAMKREFARQDRGATFNCTPRDEDVELARCDPDVIEGDEPAYDGADAWKFEKLGLAISSNTTHLLIKAQDLAHYDRLRGYEMFTFTFPNGTPGSGTRFNQELATREQALLA